MSRSPVNINFIEMAKALRSHVREKAARSNSTIVYLKDGVIVEENPKNNHRKVIRYTPSKRK